MYFCLNSQCRNFNNQHGWLGPLEKLGKPQKINKPAYLDGDTTWNNK